MKITEVRIFPTESRDGKLKAFATMTFDDWFVVRNVKIIQGNSGLFVAMPSRKAMDSCPKCHFKNVIGSKYCNQCGKQLPPHQGPAGNTDEAHSNHMDIAHPITQECRVYIQDKVLESYNGQAGQASGQGTKTSDQQEIRTEKPAESKASAVVQDDKPTEDEKTQPATSDITDLENAKDIEL